MSFLWAKLLITLITLDLCKPKYRSVQWETLCASVCAYGLLLFSFELLFLFCYYKSTFFFLAYVCECACAFLGDWGVCVCARVGGRGCHFLFIQDLSRTKDIASDSYTNNTGSFHGSDYKTQTQTQSRLLSRLRICVFHDCHLFHIARRCRHMEVEGRG